MVADGDKAAGNGYRDCENEVFLITGEAKPLEYAGRVDLDSAVAWPASAAAAPMTNPPLSLPNLRLKDASCLSPSLF